MDTLMKADIFFFVTTIAVIVFLILGSIAFYYIIKTLRNIKNASDTLSHKIEIASENADTLYHSIADSFLFHMLFGKKKPSAKSKK